GPSKGFVGDLDSLGKVVRIGSTRYGRRTFLGKLIDYGSFYGGVVWTLIRVKPKADLIVAMTTPPYLSIIARGVSRMKTAMHSHWVMDLYPDVMVAHGMIRGHGILHRFLGILTRWGFGGRRCLGVLSLGPDMMVRIDSYL